MTTSIRPLLVGDSFDRARAQVLTIAEALLKADRAATEGQLAPRLNALVRGETCAEIARQIGLGEVLKLGRSEMMTGGRRKDALLGDAMEAVIAAVYLDACEKIGADVLGWDVWLVDHTFDATGQPVRHEGLPLIQ